MSISEPSPKSSTFSISLEGSVRKSGNIVRVTAQLIDVATDAHLWSQTYNGEIENIFAVQDTISSSVARALNATLLGVETPVHPVETNLKAYNAYLQGEHFNKLGGKEDLEKAIGYYEQALDIDQRYASAWVGLARVHLLQADRGQIPVAEGYRKSRQEVEKALELDQNLASAYLAMGWIHQVYDWDWSGADAALQRALQLEPGNADVVRGGVAGSHAGKVQGSAGIELPCH